MARFLLYFTSLLFCSEIFAQYRQQRQLEQFFDRFPINTTELGFMRLGGSTVANFMVKQNGEPIFNLKCTQTNTFHKAAIIVYELGKKLEIDLYPVARPISVNRKIDYFTRTGGKLTEGSIILNEECALKEWVPAFAPYFWIIDEEMSKDSFAQAKGQRKQLTEWLRCDMRELKDADFRFYAKSKRGSPGSEFLGGSDSKAIYSGTSSIRDVARDFSNMMLMDALIGNDDRFPGGNIHFRPTNGEVEKRKGRIHFENARLFSLDNESALRGKSSLAIRNFTAKVTRFDRGVVRNLIDLRDQLNKFFTNPKVKEQYVYLDGQTWKVDKHLVPFLLENIDKILSHVKKSERSCGIMGTYF